MVGLRAGPGSQNPSHPQPGAGQPEGTGVAPVLGIGHLSRDEPGHGLAGGPSSWPMARQGRAVGSWRVTLLYHLWGRG